MEGESTPPTTTVPVKISQPEGHAPPTLAEPASGPVAEMSGALQGSEELTDLPNKSAPASSETIAANGTNEPQADPTEIKSAGPADLVPDTEETQPISPDADLKGQTGGEDAPETNGAASSVKKGSNGKRKSTGGVPEHKSKKLNKKKSMPKMTQLDAKPGDYFFARLKSYPPWPSIICDEEMLPQSLISTRPVTTKQEDGTYREAYTDGAKKVHERTFPVMFLHTNEFAWMPNTELAPLDPVDCKDVSEKGKAKMLIAAYHVAAEAHDLQFFKDMLVDHARAVQEDEEAREAREAEKAAKAEKKKRKSDVTATGDGDVEMDDGDDAGETKKSSKKRKKEAGSEDEAEKPAKTPKTTKLKLTTSKTPTTTEKKSKDSTKASKPKSEKRKSKAVASDEEMEDADTTEPPKPIDPVEERKAREKEVLFLRHKLQKGFLSRDQAPQEDEMPQMSSYIKKLENYGDLEVSIIRTTKIHKVLKTLLKLNTIPKDEEYNFRSRSMELLSKWNKILGSDNTDGDAAGPSERDTEPATNGVHKEDTAEGSKEVKPTVEDKPLAPAASPESEQSAEKETKAESMPGAAQSGQEAAPVVMAAAATDATKATE